jgi:hypothetical protein
VSSVWKWIKRVALGLLVSFVALMAFGSWRASVDEERRLAGEAAAQARAASAATERCQSQRAELIATHARLASEGKHADAAAALSACAARLQDRELGDLMKASNVARLQAEVASSKETPHARLAALDQLRELSPEAASAFNKLGVELKAAAEAADRKMAAQAERQRLAKARKEGVRVGMTAKQVLESSWGKPESVNRTTTASSVNEQWVYGGGSYLYFDNGVLTAIQN